MQDVNQHGRGVSEDVPAGNGSDDVVTEPAFWHSLIDEKQAAAFLGLERRTMQGMRQRGGGPRYFRISSRCLRYRRIDLRDWFEARMRSSTSDPG